jgi:hypothetical protein
MPDGCGLVQSSRFSGRVLEDVPGLPRAWMIRRENHEIAGLVARPATLPVAVGLFRFTTTLSAALRLGLLRSSALAGVRARHAGHRR